MKILVVSLNYAPELTATGKYTGEMAEWLAAEGHEIVAIAAPPHYPRWSVDNDYRGKGFHTESLNGVTTHRVPCYIPPADKAGAVRRILMETSFTFLSLPYWLKYLTSRHRFDCVISVCPPMQPAALAILYSFCRRSKMIFHVQDLQVDMATKLGMIKNRGLIKLLYGIEKWILRRSDLITTITNSMVKQVINKGVPPDKITLFPNWANISQVYPLNSDEQNTFRADLGLGNHDFLCVYSGAMGEKQGLEIIIEAAKQLHSQSRLHFLIAGEGGVKQQLHQSAKQLQLHNVHFFPLQPLAQLNQLLNAADFHLVIQKSHAADFVMPSKLTNIMAAGKAVVATADKDTELHDVINNFDTGFTCPPENATALADTIKNAISDPDKLQKQGKNARQYATTHTDKYQLLSQFSDKLRTLLPQQF